jgi:hypothetical protein
MSGNVGGGIVVSTTTGSSQADLPAIAGWTIQTTRSTAAEVSLAGSVIRQSAQKSITTGTATYSGMVNSTQAGYLQTIDNANTTVILSDGSNVYEAIMDVNVGLAVKAGKRQVDASFVIVRRIK